MVTERRMATNDLFNSTWYRSAGSTCPLQTMTGTISTPLTGTAGGEASSLYPGGPLDDLHVLLIGPALLYPPTLSDTVEEIP